MRRATRLVLTATLLIGIGCRGGAEPAPAQLGSGSAAIAGPLPVPRVPDPRGAHGADPWAKAPDDTSRPPPVSDPVPHPFFWSIARDGKTTDVLGTLHMGVDAEARLPAWVWARFDAATVLAEETDLGDPTLGSWSVRGNGPTLQDELGSTSWARLTAIVTPGELIGLRLSSIAMTAVRVSGYGSDLPETPAMDQVLYRRATAQHKQLVFLEEPAVQLALFHDVFDREAVVMLLDRLDQLAELNQQYSAAYLSGDATRFAQAGSALFRLQSRDEATYRRLVARMFGDRNRAWLAGIELLHQTGNAFVAVGALHLMGPGNLLDLLAADGFTVTRVAR